MQKWEYLHVFVRHSEGVYKLYINSEAHPVSANDQSNPSRLLNRFGQEGWELVQGEEGTWIFKRPKS